MTKRIIALLVAAIMAVSCCMLVACTKEEPKKPEQSSAAASSDKKSETSETSKPATSETSTPADSSSAAASSEEPKTSDEPGDGYFASIEATHAETSDMYSTSTPWENWNGYFQFLPQFYKDEVDATAAYGTEDYEWTWTVYMAPALEDGSDNTDAAAFKSCTAQLDTLYDWGTDDGKVIYRLQTGSLTKDCVVDQEYEVIVTVENGTEKFKSQFFVVWTEESQKNQDAWNNGLMGNGDEGTTMEEKGIEKHIPTTCPCDF